MEENKTSVQISQEEQGNRQKTNSNDRSRVAALMLFTIVPIILLATLSLYFSSNIANKVFGVYNVIFKSLLLAGLSYLIYEIVNFIKPKNNSVEYSQLFYTLVIGTGIVFGLTIVNDLLLIFDVTFLHWVSKLWIQILFFMIVGIVCVGLAIFTWSIDMKDVFVALVVTLLSFLFMHSVAFMSITKGWQTIFLFLGLTIISDTTAYYGGLKYGTKKMAPTISPSKSWEGFYIGLMSAITFGIVWWLIVFVGLDNINGFLVGLTGLNWFLILAIVVAAIMAPLGDLFFSYIKRSYDKKDFSNLLQGHGGLLDRIDSHIFALISATTIIILFA